jgi:hypothetical protein
VNGIVTLLLASRGDATGKITGLDGDPVHYQIAGLANGKHSNEVRLNYQTLAYACERRIPAINCPQVCASKFILINNIDYSTASKSPGTQLLSNHACLGIPR